MDVPDDVAALFHFANLKGVRYRDFSAARRADRGRMRHRVTLMELESEVIANAEAGRPGGEALLDSAQADPESPSPVILDAEGTVEGMLPSRHPRRHGNVWMHMAQLLGAAESGYGSGEERHDRFGEMAAESEELFEALPPDQTASVVDQYAKLAPYAARAEDVSAMSREPVSAFWNQSGRAGDAGTKGVVSGAPSWMPPKVGTPRERRELEEGKDTLQHSRQWVASRWYALREVFSPTPPEEEAAEEPFAEQVPPLLAIFSVAGGVGKTTLAASLTRALAAQGERVLLVDTTGRGVLPFFFGSHEVRAESVRTFAPPSGYADQPVHLVSYARQSSAEEHEREGLEARLRRDSQGFSRVVVDLGPGAQGDLEAMVRVGARVLVPLAPDMHSVISLASLRQIGGRLLDGSGKPVRPVFLLSSFSASEPLQLDVRETLRQQLGEALLPFVVRRSPMVDEALAEGMTVIDYAGGDAIAKDYVQVATWLRSLEEPARGERRRARWSER